ncbi:MAG: hypothetical protein Q4P18_08020 [Methanobrevibacter sp.]|uniref:hypothetical protein n=1 Tax=Methanobrevibacter sp. TaxID=66852 RepID=UPI0026DF2EDE|nr:hypothetical protein [Methanobrevibacter sp.]MDO5849467.1 hypothetical protein [Methanobrevibacter sp.]
MYLELLEGLNRNWGRLCTLEELNVATLEDYHDFSVYVHQMVGIINRVSDYGEAQELFEDTRYSILTKLREK